MNDVESEGNVASWCLWVRPARSCRLRLRSSAGASVVYPPPAAPDPLAPLPPVRSRCADGARRDRPAAVRPRQGGARSAPICAARHRSASSISPSRRASRASTSSTSLSGTVESHRVAHGRGSDPDHSGFLERFSNDFGSYATSNGTYTTGDYYDGKYGLSMKVRGLDWTNNNAEPRAIVIHNAWYAEPDMIALHGMLGRSEGCFAMAARASTR